MSMQGERRRSMVGVQVSNRFEGKAKWAVGAGLATLLLVLVSVQDSGGELQEAVLAEPGPVILGDGALATVEDLMVVDDAEFDSDVPEELDNSWKSSDWGVALQHMLDSIEKAPHGTKGSTDSGSHKSTAHISDVSPGKNDTGAARFVGDEWKRYLFLTSHGGNKSPSSNNVRIYDYSVSAKHLHHWVMQGYALEEKVVEDLGLQNLRGMKIVGDALFIVSAHSSRSKIIVTKKCSFDPRKAHTFTTDELDHPYGLAFFRGRLFTASQNTDEVVCYDLQDGFNAKAKHFATVKNPRGLAFDRYGRLWVASTSKGIFVLDGQTGALVQQINIKHPVGVAIHFKSNTMFIGSVAKKRSKIYGVDASSFKIVKELEVSKPYTLTHPAGIVVAGDRLFAVGQDSTNLYAWDVRDGSFKGSVLSDLPTRPEQVAILKCPRE